MSSLSNLILSAVTHYMNAKIILLRKIFLLPPLSEYKHLCFESEVCFRWTFNLKKTELEEHTQTINISVYSLQTYASSGWSAILDPKWENVNNITVIQYKPV